MNAAKIIIPKGLPKVKGHIRIRDLTGLKFNRLTVIAFVSKELTVGSLWQCRCECGNILNVTRGRLQSGNTKSCGCYKEDVGRSAFLAKWERGEFEIRHTHSQSIGNGTKEYRAWKNMKTRCYYEKNKLYKNHGGRGIIVCDRWLHSFENFFADMGCAPTPKHSVERKNNDGNYEPDNCVWATTVEQSNNRRSCQRYTIGSETLTITQWARKSGLKPALVRDRLVIMGWTIQQAIAFQPSLKNRIKRLSRADQLALEL